MWHECGGRHQPYLAMELLVALIAVIGLQLCDSVQMLASEAALANLGGGGHRRGIDVLCAQMVWLERVCKHWDAVSRED